MIKAQVTVILENTSFKDLSATWAGLYYLVKVGYHNSIEIKLLNIKWEEIPYHINSTNTLDSPLAHKLLDELELPGNNPLSLIIGNYDLNVSCPFTIGVLESLAKICATVFCPFISTITPDIFDIDNFAQLAKVNIDLHHHKKFKYLLQFAHDKNSSFIGLIIPRVLYPSLVNYKKKSYCPILGVDIAHYNNILGNAAYAYAAVVITSFIQTGWFLDTTGLPENDNEELGLVPRLRAETFFENKCNIPFGFFKYITEFYISDQKEKALARLGFIPLCQVKNRDIAVFYSNNSIRSLEIESNNYLKYETTNYLYTLQYMLCVCRVAHYIKIIGRQKLGLYSNIGEFQNYLNNWLLQYISSNIETPLSLKHKYPLLAAKVEISQGKSLKDSFNCMIYLQPHLISMQAAAEIVLNTKIDPL
ncbi:VipB superfamily type VI secretion protein (plasmid) [Candidatus Trichorickettsia mobilis]|nr:VipB superfamily type VI secretion protein [Candidatus Trichorickettsia mobilis]